LIPGGGVNGGFFGFEPKADRTAKPGIKARSAAGQRPTAPMGGHCPLVARIQTSTSIPTCKHRAFDEQLLWLSSSICPYGGMRSW